MLQEVCAGGFLMKNNQFLFGKRSADKSWAGCLWDIVGGHSKKKETPFNTLKRETLEEIGVDVQDAKLIKVMDVMEENSNATFKYYIFMITEWSGSVKNCSAEHTELRWFTRNELNTTDIALPEYLSLIDAWLEQNKTLND